MSFSDNSQVELRALVPPEFNSHCSKCGLLKKLLPWHVSFSDGSWGAICDNCAKPFLIHLLRRRLPPMFSEVELLEVLCGLGLGKKESEFLFQDFPWQFLDQQGTQFVARLQKEGIIRTRGKGFSLFNDEPAVVRLGSEPKNAHKRKYHRLTDREIFLKCVELSREILNAERLH